MNQLSLDILKSHVLSLLGEADILLILFLSIDKTINYHGYEAALKKQRRAKKSNRRRILTVRINQKKSFKNLTRMCLIIIPINSEIAIKSISATTDKYYSKLEEYLK